MLLKALIEYAQTGNSERARDVLAQDASLANMREQSGQAALHYASLYGNVEVIKVLCEFGANVDVKTEMHTVPLHYAARSGSKLCVKKLLEMKANVNMVDVDGETPLHFGARNGHYECCEMMCAAGANANAVNKMGLTPFMEACVKGFADVAGLLIKYGADVSMTGPSNYPALVAFPKHRLRSSTKYNPNNGVCVSGLQKSMHEMFTNKDNGKDFALVNGSQRVMVHKAIAAARSPIIAGMGDAREIAIECKNSKSLPFLAEWMYTDVVTELAPSQYNAPTIPKYPEDAVSAVLELNFLIKRFCPKNSAGILHFTAAIFGAHITPALAAQCLELCKGRNENEIDRDILEPTIGFLMDMEKGEEQNKLCTMVRAFVPREVLGDVIKDLCTAEIPRNSDKKDTTSRAAMYEGKRAAPSEPAIDNRPDSFLTQRARECPLETITLMQKANQHIGQVAFQKVENRVKETCLRIVEDHLADFQLVAFVDPVTNEIAPGYSSKIKRPVCLRMLQDNLHKGAYKTLGDFVRDLRQMWQNCLIYNPKGTDLFLLGEIMAKRTEERLLKIQWRALDNSQPTAKRVKV